MTEHAAPELPHETASDRAPEQAPVYHEQTPKMAHESASELHHVPLDEPSPEPASHPAPPEQAIPEPAAPEPATPERATKRSSHEPESPFWREMRAFKVPEAKAVAPVPKVGSRAPSAEELPFPNGKATLLVFLRHCGCPFAEKAFKTLSAISNKVPTVHCVAVSHSSSEATEKWIPQVGGVWDTDVVIDEDRDLYASWGLGLSSTWGIVSPRALYSTYRLGADEGVWNRPTESGNRWQLGGAFAVDEEGIVRWAYPCTAADDLPDLNAGVVALGYVPK
ncbi:hypothetical protein ESCO_001089 [Escovopsis weberi]|uniref:Thioredoxin domain-containing protein n=1 Tax=Escovopsis weberi TaxID=150374 RepID=A0A0M8N3K7_ESCWE|nr:hypothetical protein ESCO_001089 [Escovopsis weberi]